MHKCRAVGGDPLLLLANRATIRQFDIVTNRFGFHLTISYLQYFRYHPVINSLESAVALDYWHEKKLLIWSDVSKEQISLCNIGNDTHTAVQNFVNCIDDNRTLISDHVVTPDGLAIDWVHGLLYWTDTGLDTVIF
jgi:low-density lipoprotein receptor